jgi:hypothetical protein
MQNAQHNTLTDLVLGAKHMGQKNQHFILNDSEGMF